MHCTPRVRYTEANTAAIVQWQNAALWQRMSWVRNPLAAPIPPQQLQRQVPRKSPATSARLFSGTSGWAYPTWKPGFYPDGTSAKKFLNVYASQLNSVEVNYTFTKLPTATQLEGWLAQVPDDFRFSFKAPQRITHFSRLIDCETHVTEFLTSLAPAIQARKTGLILFQLPPNFKADLQRLGAFLELPALRKKTSPPLAFEFRNLTWFTPETMALLTEFNAALCIADTEDFVTPEFHTATTHTAFRLRHSGGYKPRQIASLAQRLTALSSDRDVYAYFKHEDEPTGALNALAFRRAAARAGK